MSRKNGRPRKRSGGGVLAVLVGVSSFIFGGAVYFVSGGSTIVVFGTVAVIFAYLVFDIIELGALGAQLFLSVFGLISAAALATFGNAPYAGGTLMQVSALVGAQPAAILGWGLLLTSVILLANVAFDVRVLRRTSIV